MTAPSVVVIGAGGTQARGMLTALANAMDLSGVLAVDRVWSDNARSRVEALGAKTMVLDVIADRDELAAASDGARLIANLAGPFYVLGTSVLELAVALGLDYLDICDDADATSALLAIDGRVREARIRALIGMGSSPGTTNVLVRFALDALDPEVRPRVDIAWVVDAVDMTPAATDHFLHCFATAIPGRSGTPEWEELEPQVVEFPQPVGRQMVVTLGHPEPLTLPRFTRVSEVVNKGGVSPAEYLHLSWVAARLLEDGAVTPEIHELYQRFDGLASGLRGQSGSGLQIDVTVEGCGYRFSSGASMAMEDATGIPTAAGVIAMLGDPGLEVGISSPECLEPGSFFDCLRRVSKGGGGLRLFRLEGGEPTERIRIRDLLARAASG